MGTTSRLNRDLHRARRTIFRVGFFFGWTSELIDCSNQKKNCACNDDKVDQQRNEVPADAAKAGAITWNYGSFITLLINFVIVAGAVFLLVRAINELRRPAEKEPDTKDCPACAMKIPVKATRCPHCTSELSHAAAR